MLILTCGANGSYVFTPEIVSFLPTPSVKVKDTVGAGDSFTAAFVSSILEGSTVGKRTAAPFKHPPSCVHNPVPHRPFPMR